MLLISNGAMKSGSTWLTSILLKMMDYEPLPEGFHDERFGNIPTIKPNLLPRFLEQVDYANHNYISKNHLYYEHYLLSRYRHVYVLDIDRDVPDTLVSFFFHIRTKMIRWGIWNADLDDIRKAYWQFGPSIVEDLVRYHSVWGRKCAWTYASSYERLKENLHGEIAAIAQFLGVTMTKEKLDAIVRDTSFETLAKASRNSPGMDVRFRKGEVGDHRNHFDAEIISDIRRVEALNRGYPRNMLQKIDFLAQCWLKAGKNHPFPREPQHVAPKGRPLKAVAAMRQGAQ